MLATTIHETESLFRAEPEKARSKPAVTATLANGRARLSAGLGEKFVEVGANQRWR